MLPACRQTSRFVITEIFLRSPSWLFRSGAEDFAVGSAVAVPAFVFSIGAEDDVGSRDLSVCFEVVGCTVCMPEIWVAVEQFFRAEGSVGTTGFADGPDEPAVSLSLGGLITDPSFRVL